MPLSPALKLVIFIFAAFAFAYLTYDILDGGAWASSIVQSSSEQQFISRKLRRPVIRTAKEESENEEQKENDKTADRSPTEIEASIEEAIGAIGNGSVHFSRQEKAIEIGIDFDSIWRQNVPVNLPLCPKKPPGLQGRLQVDLRFPPMEVIESEYPELEAGGRWRPKNCRAWHRVAFILPFRDRAEHLRGFLHNAHRIFQRQQLDYAIFVVEQFGHNLTFNKGRLMNVGVLEATKLFPFDCVVFHDVDTIPENDFNLYTCPTDPNRTKHLGVAIDHLAYKLMYEAFLGGATILTEDQVRRANGYSNDFWGWGGEDDDFYARVNFAGMKFWRPPADIARYTTFNHERDKGNKPNPCRFEMLKYTKRKQPSDGLNSIRYRIKSMEFGKLYTHIMVDVLQSEYQKFQQYLKTLKGC